MSRSHCSDQADRTGSGAPHGTIMMVTVLAIAGTNAIKMTGEIPLQPNAESDDPRKRTAQKESLSPQVA
ncbi:MAG: hypothetical protein WCO75_08050 [Planctomycetota bacterium]